MDRSGSSQHVNPLKNNNARHERRKGECHGSGHNTPFFLTEFHLPANKRTVRKGFGEVNTPALDLGARCHDVGKKEERQRAARSEYPASPCKYVSMTLSLRSNGMTMPRSLSQDSITGQDLVASIVKIIGITGRIIVVSDRPSSPLIGQIT